MMRLIVSATRPEPDRIAAAVELLHAGGVVAYPTDTLYALAVDPRRPEAVRKLVALKGRRATAAFPLIAASIEQAEAAGTFGPPELRLARTFWPGPLSIVVPARAPLAAEALAGGQTVAVRVPDHALARALAAAAGFCITSTSANLSGSPPARSPGEVEASLGAELDGLLDAGAAPGGAPSTIVELRAEGPALIRPGAVPWERVLRSLQ